MQTHQEHLYAATDSASRCLHGLVVKETSWFGGKVAVSVKAAMSPAFSIGYRTNVIGRDLYVQPPW